MKYSFIVPYCKRPSFRNTLMSFHHFYGKRTDYQVVLVEDKKNVADDDAHNQLLEMMSDFKNKVPIKHLLSTYDNYACPCSMYNWGVDEAESEYVVITNPECAHVTDILSGFDAEFEKDKNVYVVAACETVSTRKDAVSSFEEFEYVHIKWYQHSKYNNRLLNWCTALSKKNYIAVRGFNEEFDKGLGRADVVFIKHVAKKIRIVARDDLICVHQAHDKKQWRTAEGYALVSNNQSCKVFKSRFPDESTRRT